MKIKSPDSELHMPKLEFKEGDKVTIKATGEKCIVVDILRYWQHNDKHGRDKYYLRQRDGDKIYLRQSFLDNDLIAL